MKTFKIIINGLFAMLMVYGFGIFSFMILKLVGITVDWKTWIIGVLLFGGGFVFRGVLQKITS